MKINNKEILILLVTLGIVLTSVYTYSVKSAATPYTEAGDMVLMDQKISEGDYQSTGFKAFQTSVILPSSQCTGFATCCGFNFPSSVDSKFDINKDGRIDIEDVRFENRSFGCANSMPCWNDPVEECYFSINGRLFMDPTQDCYMDQNDINAVNQYFGTSPGTGCGRGVDCFADVNRDGIIDSRDSAVVGKRSGSYADVYIREGYKYQGDLTGDGLVDIKDISMLSKNLGSMSQEANQQTCAKTSLINIGNNEYTISCSGYGLYYANVAYKCT